MTPALRRGIRRRSAIEPVIVHMKSDGRLAHCPLKGTEGEMFHAIICGCGQNIRMILRWIHEATMRLKGAAQTPRHADGAAPHLTFGAIQGRHRRSHGRCGGPRMCERR